MRDVIGWPILGIQVLESEVARGWWMLRHRAHPQLSCHRYGVRACCAKTRTAAGHRVRDGAWDTQVHLCPGSRLAPNFELSTDLLSPLAHAISCKLNPFGQPLGEMVDKHSRRDSVARANSRARVGELFADGPFNHSTPYCHKVVTL